VNYTRMASWAFQMRKYRDVEAAVLYFQYESDSIHPWQKDFISVPQIREDIECLARASDVMIWQAVHYDHTLQFFNEIKQKYGKPMFVETDDNHLDVPNWNNAYNSYSPSSFYRQTVNRMMGWSDGLIVTTPHLKEVYEKFNPNIHIVENSLDFKGDRKYVGWDTVSVRKHRGIRIGWIGGRSHFNDLMMVAPALREILLEYPEVTLVLVNSALQPSCHELDIPYPFQGLSNVHYADRSVSINRFPMFMASFGMDIGIAPLVDCNFNRSKSNLRWLEYGALKIPCVASSISHFSQTVKDGKDGILVKNNDLQIWKDSLKMLIEDAGLRQEIGRQAYKRVKKDFNIKTNAAKYVRLLKKISDFSIYNEEYQEFKPGQKALVGGVPSL
jgi:glycosyltransferase involved in cell wall biosynthesis